MTVENKTGPSPTSRDLGANEFVFSGDRTSITFFPSTPGPIVIGHEGGELRYQGPEGTFTFFGKQINRLDSPLGTLLTVILQPNPDVGRIDITVLVPKVFGVTRESPVTFGTVAIKTTSRGFMTGPGVELTYDVLPLVGEAKDVLLPL
ncbi:MAG: hypothetical protein JO281_07725 [Pseudonocardiales bacterium]|nr:hypothetical protein [Pseudonocardiales bacterium]